MEGLGWVTSSACKCAPSESCAGVQAARVLQEAKPAASAEALGGSGGACPLADEAAPRLSQPACTAACRSPDGDSDLEAEQRVNAEMKERYWRLAERAALELVSDGALAASGAGAAVRRGSRPEARCVAGEEEEEDNMPPPSPRSVERRAASESAQKHAAACRRLTLRVATQTGVSKLLRFAAREPLSKLFAAFQQHAVCVGWMPEGAQPSFWFDGERLGEDVTAEGAELEDDFVIDCKW